MAVVAQNDQDQNNGNTDASNGGSGSSSAPISVASASPTGASTGKTTSSSTPVAGTSGNNQNTSSGSFTNLKDYLTANSNYNNGQGLAGQVNQNLSGQVQNINSNINNASNQFQTQTVNSTQPVTSAYNNFESNTGNGSDLNAIQNYAGNQQNVAATQNLENASYTGPQTLNDLSGANNGQTIQNSISNYNNLVQNTNTQAGLTNLLSSLYGGQGYNQGQQTLDSVFLQGQNFGGAQAAGNQLTNTYNTANNNAQAQAQQASNQVTQDAQNVVGQLNNATTGLGQNIQSTYANNLGQQAGDVTAAQTAAESGNINQALATALGLTNGEYTYNTLTSPNVGNYISANTGYDVQDAATQQQYAQVAALQNLLGNNANSSAGQVLSTFAGGMPTGNTGLLDYNQSQLATDIANQAASYNAQAQQYVNPIEQNMGDFASNVLYNNPGVTFNPYQGNVFVPNTGVGLNTNTLTATGSPVQTMLGPVNYSTDANNLLQQGEQRVLANGPAGTQVANNLAEGQTQGYAGNYNSEQSLAYLNALSALMGLNQQTGAGNTVNIQ